MINNVKYKRGLPVAHAGTTGTDFIPSSLMVECLVHISPFHFLLSLPTHYYRCGGNVLNVAIIWGNLFTLPCGSVVRINGYKNILHKDKNVCKSDHLN